jgi:energy-coupling factor transporter ATP-binding protein EcfA2
VPVSGGFVMDRVCVQLANCYGIKKLDYEFDFSKHRAYAIYAPNGAMKSSFAETFKNVAEGKPSSDRIFPSRTTVRKITDENGTDLSRASVLVLPPYDEFFGPTEKTSTLLVNATLRKEFEQLYAEVERSKVIFLKAMAAQSGSKKHIADEIALTFMRAASDEDFYRALDRIKNELAEQQDAPFADVPYDTIFDDKVLGALGTKDVRTALQEYVKRRNELLAGSAFFRSGVFEYYNAGQVAKALADNGFFKAKHTITLRSNSALNEITSPKQLEELVDKELEKLAKDPELRKKYGEIKKLFEKNITVRDFLAYISNNENLLPHLANVDLFKEQLWKSYFKANQSLYDDLMAKYSQARARRKEIEEQARKEQTHWEAAIDLFNDRFFVPFRLEAKNKIEVCLGKAPMLDLGYTFNDATDSTSVTRDTLLKSLSQGERKALYILNIIFEIEVRRQAAQETLFVVDDIADSFDYKNKYAIIQYLNDISEGPVFKQIILTHNFDFFRTVSSRFVGYANSLMAIKSTDGISLRQFQGIRNVFVNDWKGKFNVDARKRIASIPFVRNLIEYTRGEAVPEYATLTSLLHWRPDSDKITQGDLQKVYNSLFGTTTKANDETRSVVDSIHTEATACLTDGDAANFENKIVLAIAARLGKLCTSLSNAVENTS